MSNSTQNENIATRSQMKISLLSVNGREMYMEKLSIQTESGMSVTLCDGDVRSVGSATQLVELRRVTETSAAAVQSREVTGSGAGPRTPQ